MNPRSACFVMLAVLPLVAWAKEDKSEVIAHFVMVGQADATLMEFPCGAVLIDGGSDDEHSEVLGAFLTSFFARRPDLNNTLDSIILTHHHLDHTASLPDAVLDTSFIVKRFIDNGQRTEGSGRESVAEVLASGRIPVVKAIVDTVLELLPQPTGVTGPDIDPIDCAGTDPVITILSGGFPNFEREGWSKSSLENLNNQSLVVRIDFGKASFLLAPSRFVPQLTASSA